MTVAKLRKHCEQVFPDYVDIDGLLIFFISDFQFRLINNLVGFCITDGIFHFVQISRSENSFLNVMEPHTRLPRGFQFEASPPFFNSA